MKEVIEPNITPPGGWRWKHPETGFEIHANGLDQLFGAVRLFLGQNNFPIPLDLNQRVIADLDEAIQADLSERGLPPMPFVRDTEPPSFAQRARNFTAAMAGWARDGGRIVDQITFEQRQQACHTCPHWGGSSMVGYAACGVCGCSGLKLFLASQSCPKGKWGAI